MANLVFDFLHNYKTGERRESDPADAYQYDEGHVFEAVVPVAVTSCEIHYWARGFDEAEAYTPASITQNADNSYTITGNIPNKFFETYGDLRVYIVVTDGDASITTYEGRIHICERSKPDDYVDDDPDNEATRVLVEARAAAATATEAAQTAQDVADSIPADYTQLSDDVSSLKEDFNERLASDAEYAYMGELTLLSFAHFERGSYQTDGTTTVNVNYRVRQVESVTLPYSITLIPKSGFRMYVYYIGDSNPGWENSSFTIPANKTFKVMIARVTETTSEIADPIYFAKQIVFDSAIKTNIAELEARASALETTDEHVLTLSKNLLTTYANASINSDTGKLSLLNTGESYVATPEMIKVKPSTTYMISWDEPTIKPTYAYVFEYAGTADNSFIKRVSFSVFEYHQNYKYVSSATCEYVRFMLIKYSEPWQNIIPPRMQFEEGTQITAYVEHTGINPDLIDPDIQYDRLVADGKLKYDFSVPDYYLANEYLDNKVTAINNYMDTCYATGDCFVFITDAHWEYNAKHSPALIRYLHDRTGIAKLFDGGDVANGGNVAFMEYTQTQQASMLKEAYFTMGNHEAFGGVSSSYITNRFDRYHDDYKGNPEQHYYYVDNERAKIRYIVLACYETGDGDNAFNGIGGSSAASQAQRDWLEDVALNVANGWGVVIIMHSLYYVSNVSPYSLVTESRYASTIQIMDNFVANGGTIMCILQGHTHIDRMTRTPGGIPVFITMCDKYYANETPADIIVPRTLGTIREQAFDVVCINRVAKEVKLIRVGCPAQNGFGDDVGTEAEERTMSYE